MPTTVAKPGRCTIRSCGWPRTAGGTVCFRHWLLVPREVRVAIFEAEMNRRPAEAKRLRRQATRVLRERLTHGTDVDL